MVFHSLRKLLFYRSSDIVKPRVLLIEPTGASAINFNGTAIHSALHIPCPAKFLLLFPVNDKNKMQLNNKYLEVELLIVDEILMVLNNLLFQIYKSLNDIFIPTQDIPFDGKSVLLWVELYQLQPV